MDRKELEKRLKWVTTINNYITLPCLVLSIVMLLSTGISGTWLGLTVMNMVIYLFNNRAKDLYRYLLEQYDDGDDRRKRIDELTGR